MANFITEIEKCLPVGAMKDERSRCYRYKAFVCDDTFLYLNPHFNWNRHIARSIEDCLSSTLSRFAKVV